MTELAEALERFSRKKRNLLIRSVLGHRETPLELSERFRQTLASKLRNFSQHFWGEFIQQLQ